MQSIKKFMPYRGVLLFLLYFLLIVFAALPQGLQTPFHSGSASMPFLPSVSYHEFPKLFGLHCDIASYALGGADIARYGWIQHQHQALLGIWPPGMFILEGIILKIIGISGPLVLSLVLVNAAVWAFVFYLLFRFLRNMGLSALLAGLLPCTFLFIQLFRFYMIRNGALMTDTFSTGIYVASFLASLLAIQHQKIRYAVLAGVLLAVAAYLRVQYETLAEIIMISLFGIYLLILVFSAKIRQKVFDWFQTCRTNPPNYKSISKQLQEFFLWKSPVGFLNLILLSILVFHICTVPYRFVNFFRINHFNRHDWQQIWRHPVRLTDPALLKSFSWSGLTYVWRQRWMTPTEHIQTGAAWMAQGGASVPCEVEQRQCRHIDPVKHPGQYKDSYYEYRTIRSFLKYPRRWFRLKAAYLPFFWNDEGDVNISYDQPFLNTAECKLEWMLMFVSFGMIFVYPLFYLLNQAPIEFTIPYLSACYYATAMMAYLFMHFENRYFYPTKVFAILFMLVNLPYLYRLFAYGFQHSKHYAIIHQALEEEVPV